MHNASQKELKLEIPNTKNETITGALRAHNTSKPLIVICHGYGSSMDQSSLKQINSSLFHLGHNTFVFNFSKSAQRTALENQVSDIETIVTYFISYKRIILLAGSFGALTAAIAAPKNKKIKGLITINGFFGKRHLGKKFLRIYLLFRLSAIFNSRNKLLLQFMHKEFRPENIKIPVLVIHSLADKDVSIKQSQLFYDNLTGPKKFHKMKNADHELLLKNSVTEVVKAIDEWINMTID